MPATWKTVRVFISSTFRDMQAERDHLVRFVFPKLRQELLQRRIHLVDVDLRWGVTSEQDALSVCREVVDECRPRFLCMLGGRYGGVPPGKTRSITADEVHYGVLDRDFTGRGFAYFYFRDSSATAAMVEVAPGEFREPVGSHGAVALAELKTAITESGLQPFIYRAQWDDQSRRLIGLKEFGDRVYADLKQSIDQEFGPATGEKPDEFTEENATMEAFIEERVQRFVLGSRQPIWNELRYHAESTGGNGYLCLMGAAGSGKSALLGKFCQDYREAYPQDLVIPHFVGPSPGSTDVRRTLRRLCHELAKVTGLTADIPEDPEKLRVAFAEILQKAAAQKRVLILLDAINQFDSTTQLAGWSWLPEELPTTARIILSTLSGPALESLRQRRQPPQSVELQPLDAADREAIIREFLHRYRKSMTDDQRAALLAKADAGTPLYLLVALEELRTLGTYEEITDRIAQLPPDTRALFIWILKRLEDDDGFRDASGRKIGRELVSRFVSLLGASRHGLSQQELVALLSPGDPQGNVAALAQLLRPYLMQRGELLDFYHSQFREAAEVAHLDTPEKQRAAHQSVATCLQAFADPHRDGQCRDATPHALSELPHHQTRAEAWSDLIATLENIFFLEARITHNMAFDLAEDFTAGVNALPSEHVERQCLRLLDEALRRDIHFIARHAADYPQALFQCLWNSCWWYDCAEVAEHYFHYDRGTEEEHLHRLMEQWRKQRETVHPGFIWLRSLRPPRVQLRTPLLRAIAGHEDKVASVAFSSAGDRIVSGSWDHTVRVWNARNGRELACLRGHEDAVSGVAFSPTGDRIVSCSWDKTIRIWDVSSGHELARLVGHEDAIRAVSISPDGKKIASAGGTPTKWGDGVNDYSIRVWDASNGRELACLRGHKHEVESVSFSPTGDRIVSGSWDKTVRIWDATNGQELACLCRHENEIRSVSFSPDGSRIVSGSDDGTVKVWDAASGREIFPIWVGPKSVRSVSFSPAGNLIVSGSKDTTVRVWNARTGQEVACLCGHGGAVNSVSFSPDGGQILSGSDDKTVRTWGVSKCREPAHLRGHTDTIMDVRFSPTGDRIVSGAMDGTIRVWDAGSGRELACLHGGHGNGKTCFLSVWFSPDGTRIVSRASGDTVWVWDVGTGRNLARIAPYARWDWAGVSLREFEHYCKLLFFSPDGERIATAADENTVRVWDVNAGREFPSLRGHQRNVRGVSFSHAGDRVVTGSDDRTVRVWDVNTGQELARLRGHEGAVFRVAFSPDDRQIVSGSDDRTIRVWEIETWREVICLRGHEGRVSSVSFSPDGSRVISALSDKTVRVWDVDTGQQLVCLSGHEAWVRSVSFSPSGDRIVSASNDGTVRVWDVGSGRELACLRGAGLWSLSMGREGIASEPKDDIVRVWNAASFECLRMPDGDVNTTIRTMAFRAGGRNVETAIETLWPVREVAWFPAILNATTACTTRRPWVGTSVEYLYLLVLEGRINETGSPLMLPSESNPQSEI